LFATIVRWLSQVVRLVSSVVCHCRLLSLSLAATRLVAVHRLLSLLPLSGCRCRRYVCYAACSVVRWSH
jgi:hypothetical protein